jgi:hypothetical protein
MATVSGSLAQPGMVVLLTDGHSAVKASPLKATVPRGRPENASLMVAPGLTPISRSTVRPGPAAVMRMHATSGGTVAMVRRAWASSGGGEAGWQAASRVQRTRGRTKCGMAGSFG